MTFSPRVKFEYVLGAVFCLVLLLIVGGALSFVLSFLPEKTQNTVLLVIIGGFTLLILYVFFHQYVTWRLDRLDRSITWMEQILDHSLQSHDDHSRKQMEEISEHLNAIEGRLRTMAGEEKNPCGKP